MLMDRIILIIVWVLTIAGLVAFVPHNKIRDAHIIFLFKQALTWFFGMVVVQAGLIIYPVREFPKATEKG